MFSPHTPSSRLTPSISLPPNHFLSLAPSFSQPNALYPSGAPSTSSAASNGLAPNTASLASADFEVDVRTGFLPATKNVERLSGEYEVWEEALDAARGSEVGGGVMLGGKRGKDQLWRAGVESVSDFYWLESLHYGRMLMIDGRSVTGIGDGCSSDITAASSKGSPCPHVPRPLLRTHNPSPRPFSPERAHPHSSLHLHPSSRRVSTFGPSTHPHLC